MVNQPNGAVRVKHFLRVQQMGVSGLGAIYLAIDTRTNQQVTLRALHQDFLNDRRYRDRFMDEVTFAAEMNHPNVCPVLEVGALEDGTPFIALKPIDAAPLASKLQSTKPWEPRAAVEFVLQVADGVGALHRYGRLHCDLNPNTILVLPDGTPLVDHGLSHQVNDSATLPGMLAANNGQQAYLAPEQIEGPMTTLGPATDVYSLGIILYQLLTGRLPFEDRGVRVYDQILKGRAPAPTTLRADLDPALNILCMQAIARRIDHRPQTMQDLSQSLRSWLQKKPTTAHPTPGVPPGLQSISDPLLDSGPADLDAMGFDSSLNLPRARPSALPSPSASTVQQPRPEVKKPTAVTFVDESVPPKVPNLPPAPDPRRTIGPGRDVQATMRPGRDVPQTMRPPEGHSPPGAVPARALPSPASILQPKTPAAPPPAAPPPSGPNTELTLTNVKVPISLPEMDDLGGVDQPAKTLPPREQIRPITSEPLLVEPEQSEAEILISAPTVQDQNQIPPTMRPPPKPPAQQPQGPPSQGTIVTMVDSPPKWVEPEVPVPPPAAQAQPGADPLFIAPTAPVPRRQMPDALPDAGATPQMAPTQKTMQPGSSPSMPLFPPNPGLPQPNGLPQPGFPDNYPPQGFPDAYPQQGFPGSYPLPDFPPMPGTTDPLVPGMPTYSPGSPLIDPSGMPPVPAYTTTQRETDGMSRINVVLIGAAFVLLLMLLVGGLFVVFGDIILPQPATTVATQPTPPTSKGEDPPPTVAVVVQPDQPVFPLVAGYPGAVKVKITWTNYNQEVTIEAEETAALPALEKIEPVVLSPAQPSAEFPVRFKRGSVPDMVTSRSLRLTVKGKDGKQFKDATLDLKIIPLARSVKPIDALTSPHAGPVTAVAFSPDGKWLALGGVDRNIEIWNARTGKRDHVLGGAKAEIAAVVFNSDSTRLAAISKDRTLVHYVLNEAGTKFGSDQTLGPDYNQMSVIAFHPNNKRREKPPPGPFLASASPMVRGERVTWMVDFWDVGSSGSTVLDQSLVVGESRVVSMQWDGTGDRLALSYANGNVDVWDMDPKTLRPKDEKKKTPLYTFRANSGEEATVMAFSSDGDNLLLGSKDGKVRLWQPRGGAKPKKLYDHGSEVTWVQFAPAAPGKDTIVASGSANGVGKIWNQSADRFEAQVSALPLTHERAVAWSLSAEGTTLCRTVSTGRVELLKSGEVTELKSPEGIRWGPIEGVALSPDGKILATAGHDSLIKLWDTTQNPPQPLGTAFGHTDAVGQLAFSPDGQWLASAGRDFTARLWKVKPLKEESVIKLPGIGYGVVFSPDSKLLAIGTGKYREVNYEYGRVILWNIANKKGQDLDDHREAVWSLAFTPDGKFLISGDSDGGLKLWTVATGEQVTLLKAKRDPGYTPNQKGNRGTIRSVTFSPDGSVMVTAGVNTLADKYPKPGEIHIWDVQRKGDEAPQILHRGSLSGHEVGGTVRAIAICPSGRTLITGGNGKEMHMWDLFSLKEVSSFTPPDGDVYCLAVRPAANEPAEKPRTFVIVAGMGVGSVSRWSLEEKEKPD